MSTNFVNTTLLTELLRTHKTANDLNSFSDDEVFELFAIQQIAKSSNLDFHEIQDGIVDGGDDGGIDSFIILFNDTPISTGEDFENFKFTDNSQIVVYISQAKLATSFQEKVLDKLHITIPLIFDLNLGEEKLWERFNTKLVEKVLILRKVWAQAVQKHITMKIRLSYACKANEVGTNKAFNSKYEQICKTINTYTSNTCEVQFTFYSAEELLQLYQKRQSSSQTLRFKEQPTAIEYRRDNLGYMGVVKLEDYYDFIVDDNGAIKEFLLEGNVRHYLDEVDVNKEIRKTLEEDFSVDFWWLNNGITIIASKGSPYGRQLHLEDVLIVNGLQSSYTIGRFYEKIPDRDERAILVKVLIVDGDDKETVDKIISSSNRQNPVTATVLRATDEIQRKLELFFSNRGYYYDRRKNYYKNQNKPARKIFSIQYAAQAIEAILNFNPSAARSKPTTLIKSDTTYRQIFDERRSFEAYLNCCLLYQQVTDFIKDQLPRDEKSDSKNFSYHVARIVASVATLQVRYTADDIKKLDMENLHQEAFERGYSLLREILSEYQNENPDDNVLNYISKSAKFTKKIDESLSRKLAIRQPSA